ncbi:MAG: DUF465 domain-containing protein [Hyphomicrobiales bacterium]
MTEEEMLATRIQIGHLRQKHRDLDAAIEALEGASRSDPLRVQRLKKQKLHLKDEIAALEDSLFPDISA